MRINSEISIKLAHRAHDRAGSWQELREMQRREAEERAKRAASTKRSVPQPA